MSNNCEFIPVVVLGEMTVLPGVMIHFDIDVSYNIKAVKKAVADGGNIVIVSGKTENETNVGVLASVRQIMKTSGKITKVLFVTDKRVEVSDIRYEDKYYSGIISEFDEEPVVNPHEEMGMMKALLEIYTIFVTENGRAGGELYDKVKAAGNLRDMIDLVAMHLPIVKEAKRRILKEKSVSLRCEFLMQCIADEINIQRYKREFSSKIKESIDENQKEYFLREQLRAIHKELGDEDIETEAEVFEEKCNNLEADEYVKEKIRKEIKRLKKTATNSSEYSVIRGYIETLLELPWNYEEDDKEDIADVKEVLDKNHFGLAKLKEQIVDMLAVRMLTDKNKAAILCLVGPPGTGKTSIVKSIAEALGKQYVRVCLGGVRDEAEIRGHRKTYVGAMPGRIITSLKKAGVNNPVILLDEIDKVSNDYKGDTHSALLEVLDPEQNKFFTDHYVEIPVDLSNVLFICTANSTDTIPGPLLDRMDVVDIAGYTMNEKFHIAKEHLIDRQRKQNGLKKSQLSISDGVIHKLIENYTREAGVRNLERSIGTLCRKAARQIIEGDRKRVSISERNLEKYLGKEKYSYEMANEQPEIGIVRGLAWTRVGGDTLEIEVNIMSGSGKIELTGNLGDVMKESAKTALSYVRTVCDNSEIEKDYFEKHDIHIHIPEGAVPKDGPSAGITMTVAIMSAVLKRKVRADIAMTGEVTLRGRVLPIGGLKEKLLAAKTAGIFQVIVPDKNRKDVMEIDSEIVDGMNIVYVNKVEQVIKEAFAD